MKIIVLNGSPKGSASVSYHHMLFLEKHFKNVQFEYVQVAKRIKTFEREVLDQLVNQMIDSDLIVWLYPVYTFTVPYQMMSFINRLMKHSKAHLLKGKKVTQFSTSKHFYDITAYNYVKEICMTLEMNHLSGMTADMNEMLTEKGRYKMVAFFDQLSDSVDNHLDFAMKPLSKVSLEDFDYHAFPEPDKSPSKILVVYNGEDYSTNVKNMINAFENLSKYQVHRFDISNTNIRGGCMGCLKCVFIGTCVYRDEFEDIYQNKIMDADVLIYASDIENHYIHEDFKLIDDRAFYNGHRVNVSSKAIGYLLNGSLNHEPNLKQILEAKAEVGHMVYLTPVTTYEENVLVQIKRLCHEVEYFIEKKPYPKNSFLEVGGMKVFRDLVYEMRSMMIDDHVYYKKHKLYDYPKPRRFMHFFMTLGVKWIRHPKRFKKIAPKLNDYMLTRYKKIIEEK